MPASGRTRKYALIKKFQKTASISDMGGFLLENTKNPVFSMYW